MQTVKKLETEKQIVFPCIYGREVKENCSVRKILASSGESAAAKYIRPKSEMVGDFKEIIDMATQALKSNITLLHNFCACCPHAALYIYKNGEK